METFGISERRACGLFNVWRSSCRYQHKPDGNGELREQLVELAHRAASVWIPATRGVAFAGGQAVNHKRLFPRVSRSRA